MPLEESVSRSETGIVPAAGQVDADSQPSLDWATQDPESLVPNLAVALDLDEPLGREYWGTLEKSSALNHNRAGSLRTFLKRIKNIGKRSGWLNHI